AYPLQFGGIEDIETCPSGQMIEDKKCKPLTKQRLERAIEKKGIKNLEITWHQRKYYVLHITKNDVPVPEWTGTDKDELRDYLNHYHHLNI
ncbi:MAG: hypothetical protein IMZ52_10695, partial [Actinobacteria bacterium]|nr:hypothetical protein [Actinomycetota bacterium]